MDGLFFLFLLQKMSFPLPNKIRHKQTSRRPKAPPSGEIFKVAAEEVGVSLASGFRGFKSLDKSFAYDLKLRFPAFNDSDAIFREAEKYGVKLPSQLVAESEGVDHPLVNHSSDILRTWIEGYYSTLSLQLEKRKDERIFLIREDRYGSDEKNLRDIEAEEQDFKRRLEEIKKPWEKYVISVLSSAALDEEDENFRDFLFGVIKHAISTFGEGSKLKFPTKENPVIYGESLILFRQLSKDVCSLAFEKFKDFEQDWKQEVEAERANVQPHCNIRYGF